MYGNLSEFTEKVGENRQEFGTKFGYDDENRPTSLTYSIGATTIGQSTTTIDKLNRTTFSAVKLGSKTFTSEYHFAAGGYGTGSVTNLVSSITQPGCNCGYGYDDNGNIASATLNGKWTGYTYDALGQLIQVNDHSDTRSGADGTTWKYTYDLGGNILKKERFVYNDTTNPLETVTYEYGDANWRDKLTAVNGSTIRYDAIGNPLHDGTWTYTWQNGRQLQKMQKAGMTAEFVYNADGLRVQKTVNGVVTGYTLHGKNVVHMTKGNDELHFFYDAQNRPAVVVYNGTAYAYVKSLQGDIVALLNGAGNVVVSYAYDAWGAPIGKSGSMAETLGSVQPFRYRGYVFDEETGLYYLRSRYYNAVLSRFINMDSVLLKGILQSNQQAYCINNPILYSDSNGHDFLEDIWKLICDAIDENQRIAQQNAQAELDAKRAVVHSVWDFFQSVVEENQRIAQENAQAELDAKRAIARSAWNLIQKAIEENQRIAQENAQRDYETRKIILFWIDDIHTQIDQVWSIFTYGTTTASFIVTMKAAQKVLKRLNIASYIVNGIFLYADIMTDLWRKNELNE